MAARRLLIIMVVLLTISTLAAALVPPPQERGEETSTSTSTTTKERTTKEPRGSDLVRAEVPVPQGDEAPREVRVQAGDQVALVVTSRQPGEVSIPDFGLIEFAGPGNDASFDLLVEEAGQFPVRFQGSGEVATIVAGDAGAKAGQS
jgi:plastocyanin